MNLRIRKVLAADNDRLHLVFTNGKRGIDNCSQLLDFGVFKELKNKQYFKQVKVIDGAVVWLHEQDICPDMLYLGSQRVVSETRY